MAARGWGTIRRHLPSRVGQEVLSFLANLLFAEYSRNVMRMHTGIQDDVTFLLMWNVLVTWREPLNIEPCRAMVWDTYLGLCCSAQCVSGLLPVAQEQIEKHLICDGLRNCKDQDVQSEQVWVTGIVFWILFSWWSREKPKLTGSWAAVLYIFLWCCLFGGFLVVLVMVRLLSHLHTPFDRAWKTPSVLTYFTRAHQSVTWSFWW